MFQLSIPILKSLHTHLEASTPTSTNWVRPGMYSADRNPSESEVVGSTRRSNTGPPEVVSTLTGAVKWRTTCMSRNSNDENVFRSVDILTVEVVQVRASHGGQCGNGGRCSTRTHHTSNTREI